MIWLIGQILAYLLVAAVLGGVVGFALRAIAAGAEERRLVDLIAAAEQHLLSARSERDGARAEQDRVLARYKNLQHEHEGCGPAMLVGNQKSVHLSGQIRAYKERAEEAERGLISEQRTNVSRVDGLRATVADLQRRLAAVGSVDPQSSAEMGRLKTDIAVLRREYEKIEHKYVRRGATIRRLQGELDELLGATEIPDLDSPD